MEEGLDKIKKRKVNTRAKERKQENVEGKVQEN